MKKIKIRKGVWETNSSSSHSVSIADTDKQFVVDMGIIPDEYGVVTIGGGEFGWEWEKINDARTKADYCAVYCQHNDAHIEMLIDVIKEQTGASEVDLSQVDGYIDHQSNSTASEAFVDKSTLRNFIFNKNSWLFTGNDNGSQEPSYYHVDEYRDGKIFPPTYKFELIIDGLVKTTKFIKKPTKEEIEDGIYYVLNGAEYNGEGKFKKESNNYNSTPKFSFNPWSKPIDFDGGKIFFVKEKEAGIEAKKIFKEKNGREFSDKDYQEINKIKNSLYSKKKSEYCEAVNFSLRDMKTDLAKERIKSLEN
jgi:hypothetical protein